MQFQGSISHSLLLLPTRHTLKTITTNYLFNKMFVEEIKVTQYDNMQRAFVGASPQLRFISSFVSKLFLFGIFIYSVCVCFRVCVCSK